MCNHNRIGIHDGAVPDMLIELFFCEDTAGIAQKQLH